MAPILLHSTAVPEAAREALRIALFGPPETRRDALLSAARVLHRDADIECDDARALVGLDENGSCG
jgi:hypothetical protein